jgi:hypothetical protein
MIPRSRDRRDVSLRDGHRLSRYGDDATSTVAEVEAMRRGDSSTSDAEAAIILTEKVSSLMISVATGGFYEVSDNLLKRSNRLQCAVGCIAPGNPFDPSSRRNMMPRNGDDIAVWLRRGLDEFEPRNIDARQIAPDPRRRRRRRGGYAVAAAAVAAAIALVLAAVPSDEPLGPPPVRAAAQVTMPGRVLDSASEGGTLWVLTCDVGCDNAREAGAGRGDLVKVDNRTGVIEETIPVNDPHSLAVGEGGVWVVNFFEDMVSRFDPATGELVASIPLSLPMALGEGPEAFKFIPFAAVAGAGAVWVATARGYVAEVDPQSNEVVRNIKVTAPAEDLAVAGESVAVAANLDGVVWIDAASGAVSTPAPIDDASGHRLSVSEIFEANGSIWAGGVWAEAIGGKPGGSYVVTEKRGIVELDPDSRQVEHVATVSGRLSISAASGSRIWLADSPSREIYALDNSRTKATFVARLDAHGTIVGSIGDAVWLVEPDESVAKYELPGSG